MTTQPTYSLPHAAGTGSSVVVDRCQVCSEPKLERVLFLGYLPPVNQMRPVGRQPQEQPAYPAELLFCPRCTLVQLGLVVDPKILFAPDYPYTSGTTKILRDNFAELYAEATSLFPLSPSDLVVDIGSNDGTLLSNFKNGGHRVHGVEPSDVGKIANERGVPTLISFFDDASAAHVRRESGKARVITAANVFAHIEDVHAILRAILGLLDDDGVFISESHYLMGILETLQYDTIYHEHLRYYSLHSLQGLLEMHGLEVVHAKRIPTHGGSIRVYAARAGKHTVRASVADVLAAERHAGFGLEELAAFRRRVVDSKVRLYALLDRVRREGGRIHAIGAPSRASTLLQYTGVDDGILDCVLEVPGSLKLDKYMPGTLIEVREESRLYVEQPDYAMLLSWHIADELMPKIQARGFRGKFIIPLPEPRIVG